MSKGDGTKIAIKFTQPLVDFTETPTFIADDEYTTPSGIPSTSNQHSATYSVENLFDGSTSTYWQTRETLPQWAMIELPTKESVGGFRFYSGSSYRPNSVDLYGSNDGINFDLIYQSSNAASTGWKEHTFSTSNEYLYYKMVVNSGHTSGRIYMYEWMLLFGEMINLSGNELAFKISGKEYKYVDGPDNNGPLIDKEYAVKNIPRYGIQVRWESNFIEGNLDNIELTKKNYLILEQEEGD